MIESQLATLAATAAPPKAAMAMMRLSLFDWAACAIAGKSEPVAQILAQEAHDIGGAAQATLVGGGRVPAARAALVNGATSHALDYDDTHFAHIGHTSVAVVPAALAVAERSGLTLAQMVRAALIGSEAAVRVGLWLGRDHYQVGYHQTATAGAFGATLAAATLRGATHDQTLAALGLAATKSAGLKSQFGTMGKPLNAGLAAQTGVECADWALAGMTSTQAGLTGPLGFGVTHHGMGSATACDGLGSLWLMENVSHKFHACCHGLHAMLEALSGLGLDPSSVTKVQVWTHPRWLSVCNQPAPDTGLAAKFSYRHTAAMALSGVDTSAIAHFSDACANRADLVALRERVDVLADADLSEIQARVVVTHAGGIQSFGHDLAAPIPLNARADKLRAKAAGLLGATATDTLWQAAQGDDLVAFLACLT